MSKDKVRNIWGDSAQEALNMVTDKQPDSKQALEQVYQYLDEFKHLSERLEMVADNCKEPHNRDSCRAIATLITTNAKIVDQKLKKYLSVIVHNKIEETVKRVTENSKYVDSLPETMPIQLEGQITDLTKKN